MSDEHPVILFDGVCNLCQWSVQFIIRRDPAGRFRFAPLQSDVGRSLVEDCGFEVRDTIDTSSASNVGDTGSSSNDTNAGKHVEGDAFGGSESESISDAAGTGDEAEAEDPTSEANEDPTSEGKTQLDAPDSVILIEDGECYVKSDVAIRVGHHLGGWYRLLWPARFVPKQIRDAVYDFVASRRYRWFGRKEQCMVPPPDVENRFLAGGPVATANEGARTDEKSEEKEEQTRVGTE